MLHEKNSSSPLRSCLVALLVAATPAFADAAIVHVQVQQGPGMEFGAGYTVGRETQCFVITPLHVVRNAPPDAITVTDARGNSATAKLVKLSVDFDAALLQVTSPAALDCPADWTDGANAVSAIESAPFLVARKVDDNGRVLQTRFFASSTSREFVELQPFGPTDELREGDSGSSLYAGSELVGMILSVKTATRVATALTQAQIHGLFGADVLPGAKRVALVQPFTYRRAENAYATVAAHEYLAEAAQMQLLNVAGAGAVPPGAEYVFSGEILDVTSTRVVNPDYKPPQRESASDSLGDRLGRSLQRRLTEEVAAAVDRTTEVQYFRVYNVDVQVEVHKLADDSRIVNLERRSFEIPETGATPADMEKTAVTNAVKETLGLTLQKYTL